MNESFPLASNPWCPICRANLPVDAGGRCCDAAGHFVPRREPREREPEPVPARAERRMSVRDLRANHDRAFDRVLLGLSLANRRVFAAFHDTPNASMGTAAAALGISRSAVCQAAAQIAAAFRRAGLPEPLYPRYRPEPPKENAA